MKSYSSKDIIKILKQNGWYEVRINGSHHQFKHHTIKATITVKHTDKDIPIGTLKSIEKNSGIKFDKR